MKYPIRSRVHKGVHVDVDRRIHKLLLAGGWSVHMGICKGGYVKVGAYRHRDGKAEQVTLARLILLRLAKVSNPECKPYMWIILITIRLITVFQTLDGRHLEKTILIKERSRRNMK